MALLILILALPFVLTLLYAMLAPVSTVMLWRWAKGEHVERIWVPLDRVAPALVVAVLVAEDTRYCRHHGVDFESVVEIMETEDLREARGGSSITQQTAKNLFLWPSRSFFRKALEFPLALWLDRVLGKRRVLEIYLNIAEWGPNGEFGIEAAARRAFGKSAADLDAHEAALLASSVATAEPSQIEDSRSFLVIASAPMSPYVRAETPPNHTSHMVGHPL